MNPVNVAIIGAGLRAVCFCKFIKENPYKAKLVVIADRNVEKAKFLNEYYGFEAKVFSDLGHAIEQSVVEAVMVATPDYLHLEPALAALKSHKHIFLEKPLALTLDDCDRIIDASKHSDSVCYLGFNMRHSPVHEKVHELIQQGKLGKLTTIEANEWYYGGKTYFRRWNRLRKYGGGLWLTKACHDFDLITWIAGAKPKTIFANSSLSHYRPIEGAGPRCRDCKIKDTCPDFCDISKPCQLEHEEISRRLQLTTEQFGGTPADLCLYNSDKDTFDNGIALIEYENDVRATYTVNVLAAKTTGRQIRVIGTEGMAEGDVKKAKILFTQRHSGKQTEYDLSGQIVGDHGGADSKIFGDFLAICRNGGTPKSGLDDGRLAVQISLAATKSDDTGTAVNM